MSTIVTKFSSLTINTKKIMNDIDREEFKRRREAAQFAAKNMRERISSISRSNPGDYPAKMSGRLKKSIRYEFLKEYRSAKIGSTDFKAHLLEFGHGDGKIRNKRPFIRPSLLADEEAIIRIMSRKYW